MHATSSYRGNRSTNTQTHRQDRLQYTAPLSLARSVIILTDNVRNFYEANKFVANAKEK